MATVKITFTFDMSTSDIADALQGWDDHGAAGRTERTLSAWASEVGACVQAQWDGLGEGELYGSRLDVSVVDGPSDR